MQPVRTRARCREAAPWRALAQATILFRGWRLNSELASSHRVLVVRCAAPLREVAVTRGAREEVTTHEERGPAAAVPARERVDAPLHPDLQGRPGRAVPAREVVRRHAARAREVAAGVERRATAVVVDEQSADRVTQPAAQ